MDALFRFDVQVVSAEALCFSLTSSLTICTTEKTSVENPQPSLRSTDHECARGRKTRLLVFNISLTVEFLS
jgi:hypothetical protein